MTQSDKSEQQYRKSGRSASFNQQRSSSGAYGKGAGGVPAPSPSLSSSSSRSFKKSNNAQGGQSRGTSPAVNSSNANSGNAPSGHNVQNGAHVQSQLQGASDAAIASGTAKPTESATTQRSTRAVPKAPTSQPATMSSDSNNPTTPIKASGDASKAFSLQFGSISPGFMNGMQIPARTSSAPPNLDEQKRDQACHDSSFRSVLDMPIPAPKQQQPINDSVATVPSKSGEAHPASKVKKDAQASVASPTNQPQKPSLLSLPLNPMQMPFNHQPQVSMQFGGPSPIQSPTSIQMPMHIPMGNAPQVQPPVFVPGLQAHPLSPQGMMHQGQGLSFSPPIGGQLPPHLGNLGMGIAPQYPQQQGGKFGLPRKTTPVKITHPDTHEELRLDKRTDTYPEGGPSGPRSHPNVPSQSQPIPSFAPSHSINYYSNSMFYPPPSSLPFSSSQISPNAQGLRFNYPVSQGHQNISFMNTAAAHGSVPGSVQVTVKPASVSLGEKVADSSLSSSLPAVEKVWSLKPLIPASEISLSQAQRELDACQGSTVQQPKPGTESLTSKSLSAAAKHSGVVPATNLDESLPSNSVSSAPAATSEESMHVIASNEGRKESLVKSISIKDHQKKMSKKGLIQPTNQSTSATGVASHTAEHGISSGSAVSETIEAKTALTSSSAVRDDSAPSVELKTESKREGLTCVSSDVSGTGSNVDSLKLVQDEQLKPETSGIKVEEGKTLLEEHLTDNATLEIPSQPSPLNSKELKSNKGSALKAIATSNVPTSGTSQKQFDPVLAVDLSEPTLKYEREGVQVPSSNKTVPEVGRTKSNTIRGKKKRKEILQKADAAGTTSDLYMAYKGPEEKKETVASAESNSVGLNLKQTSRETPHADAIESEKIAHIKAEPDDWEDAADISTTKLGTSDNGEKAHGRLGNHEKDGSGNIAKKYSRDFLLKFAEKCTDLPNGFEIASDIVEALMVTNTNSNASHFVERDSYGSSGRIMDRQFSGSRQDCRAGGMADDDRWIRQSGSFGPGRDLRLDLGYGAAAGFRPGQGGNFGVLRHPRGQAPLTYVGGILAGPMQPMGPQGGMARNNPDSDRWQRASNYQQKGLIPSPQTPLQMMHKAERKYEVGIITDEEESKQRQLKAILNKLTPQNFEKLFEQIFDKALMEPTFCEMYANFCYHLAGELPDFREDNEKITFKRLLLNKCQEEFERGEREQEEANKVEEEGEAKQSEEEREEKRIKARRRMLGNIRLIGELYKKKMLTERIMHECIKKLLGEYENPDEEDVEALCKLMSTIGDMIDHPKAKVHMDAYFERMAKLSNNMKLSSRVRFMLKDAIDLRKNKWQQRRKVEGPKKIEEVHRDAAQERQAQTSRLARGPGINAGTRRAPMDFAPRGSMLSSLGSQMGGFRGPTAQVRGFGAQDVRMDDRQSFEARTLSVPLPQRPMGDDSITLGPQGGLARGMSFRGPPGVSSAPLADVPPASGDSRRVATGLNGFNAPSERATYGSREDLIPRYGTDRSAVPATYDHLSSQERGLNSGNRGPDNSFDRSSAASAAGQRSSFTQNVPPEKGWSEERLNDMSMAAIKEFYSARDEKEVALCIKDLNSPSFHPSMIALFVTDSFERKDVERDLLAKLLVNLTKSHDGVLSQVQLVKGFESVLSTLEDAVNDAPKAAEFLGQIFAKLIMENVISLKEIGHLIHEGGEELGRLLEIGLAGDVLGSTLGAIKAEKGESAFNEIRASSDLRLEDFRPPDPKKSREEIQSLVL
ncbi:Eukaryotic translation initiation factor 4G -like protein [Gossypium arboreum]|uniref:Eukaryotic translation initiation factor 4G n=1 Tax=Gossypium arboreum TaxID=29729 RepID=A0A0B0NWH0_GOSAR|nr:Eukaryotic translation initiation factor 4G -like protein [Gossypium arboreum]